jgi:hypothetical protein
VFIEKLGTPVVLSVVKKGRVFKAVTPVPCKTFLGLAKFSNSSF